MEKIVYSPKGVCSRQIEIELDNNIIVSCKFIGGCSGNTQGIGALIKGMKVDDAIARLEGIRCGFRPSSCPDQLAMALKKHTKYIDKFFVSWYNIYSFDRGAIYYK